MRQLGFTLIEIVLVLTVGLGLIIGGIAFYSQARDDARLSRTILSFNLFAAVTPRYIAKHYDVPKGQRKGTFQTEIQRILDDVYANSAGFELNDPDELWGFRFDGEDYWLFVFPYAVISIAEDDFDRCQVIMAKIRQQPFYEGGSWIIYDRCSNPDRPGVGIQLTTYNFH